MKFLLSIMMFSLLVVGGIAEAKAGPPEDAAITMRMSAHLDVNQDNIGFAIYPEGAGLISQGYANVILYKLPDTGEVIAVVGNISDEEADLPKGLLVSGNGDTLYVTSATVIINRKSFNSHSEADDALEVGEEYFLKGDRSVYRKP